MINGQCAADLWNHSLMAVRILAVLLLPQDVNLSLAKRNQLPSYTRQWPRTSCMNVHSPLVTATTQTDGGTTPYVPWSGAAPPAGTIILLHGEGRGALRYRGPLGQYAAAEHPTARRGERRIPFGVTVW